MDKKNKQKDIFDTLVFAREEYLSSQEEEKKICAEMNEELSEAKRKIIMAYQEKIKLSKDKCSSLQKDLENYKKLLETYSTFEIETIGSIIEKLVTLFEGEDYSYQEATHETYEWETTVFGSESFRTSKKKLMIVKGNQKYGYYHDYDEQNNEVDNLIKNGQAVLLLDNKIYHNEKITFYTASEGVIKCLVDFNKFSYVKNFINLVIQFRFENNLDKICERELLSLMSEFIVSEKELIEDNYKKRALEKQQQLRQQLVNEQLKRNEELERIEFESLIQNGVPSRYNNNLIDRLQEMANSSTEFYDNMSQFEVLYDGEKHIARIICGEPLVSLENIFISKINIESSIKDYFDDSDPDPHFHGECDIDLVDDGLIGIIDISDLNQDLTNIINSSLPHEGYKVDRINDEYLRILYLPNRGKYSHKSINVYSWIIGGVLEKQDKGSTENATSYKTEWNSTEESEKMLICLKEIELLSNLNEKQLKLYKQRKNNN